jgi:sialate O-acetylesterase
MQSWDPTTPKGKEIYTATLDAVEKWLPVAEKAFAEGKPIPKQPRFPAPLEATDSNYLSNGELSLLYYGMVHPIKGYAIRGMVWSLGEGGCLEVAKYRYYLAALFKSWRAGWGQGDFPIYVELLASVGQATPAEDLSKPPAEKLDFWTRLREEQALVKNMVPNIELAYSCDVSDYVSDARNRQDAANRLAKIALAKSYGRNTPHSGPVYKTSQIKEGTIIVEFDHADGGLIVGKKEGLAPLVEIKAGAPVGFAVAGEDKKWHWASARIEGNRVVLQSPQVPSPKWARYAIGSNPGPCNLYNKAGLPALPFRTDGDQ